MDRERAENFYLCPNFKAPTMKYIFLFIGLSLMISCGSTQKATEQLESGNYGRAFDISYEKLQKDKGKKSAEKHVPLIKEAYDKAAKSDLAAIKQLQKSTDIESLKKIYGLYLNLDLRQDQVKVLQPLYYEGKEVTFTFNDYADELAKSKNNYAKALYNEANKLLKGDKKDAQRAFSLLQDLNYVAPEYKNDIAKLLEKAKNKASVFVLIDIENKVKDIKRDSLEKYLSVNTSNFADKWVIYHQEREKGRKYDYNVGVQLASLTFGPEETKQETVPQERTIQDGWKYKLDSNGNVMKDSEGNDIKEPKYKKVQAEVMLYQQQKSAVINGEVSLKDLDKKNTAPKSQPVTGEAKFQHTYAKYRGDQRAIDQKYYEALQAKEVKYPKEYLFVNYALRDMGAKITAYLQERKFE